MFFTTNLPLDSVLDLGESVQSCVVTSGRGVVHLCVVPSGLSSLMKHNREAY